jgi:hypothetical protein
MVRVKSQHVLTIVWKGSDLLIKGYPIRVSLKVSILPVF